MALSFLYSTLFTSLTTDYKRENSSLLLYKTKQLLEISGCSLFEKLSASQINLFFKSKIFKSELHMSNMLPDFTDFRGIAVFETFLPFLKSALCTSKMKFRVIQLFNTAFNLQKLTAMFTCTPSS